jgi:hypothetical protein
MDAAVAWPLPPFMKEAGLLAWRRFTDIVTLIDLAYRFAAWSSSAPTWMSTTVFVRIT